MDRETDRSRPPTRDTKARKQQQKPSKRVPLADKRKVPASSASHLTSPTSPASHSAPPFASSHRAQRLSPALSQRDTARSVSRGGEPPTAVSPDGDASPFDRSAAVDGSAAAGTLLEGHNAVWEFLRAGRSIDKLFVSTPHADILAEARQRGIPVQMCERRKLDRLSPTGNHQGVIAQVAAQDYVSLDDLFAVAEERGEPPLFVVCDGIEDPHNLGAILRSAEAAGAHGVIIPKRRAVGLTAVVARASAGALAYMGVHKAGNLVTVLRELQQRGVWLFGAEANGDTLLYDAPFDRPTALVIGSEGRGLSRLVRECCDYIIQIPLKGRINSLNASNAAAILLFEAVRRRR